MNTSNESTSSKISEGIAIPSLQFAFGILGNILALTILVKTSNVHKWKPFYRLVGGLAVTDFFAVALTYPFIMLRYGSGFTYDYPQEVCNLLSFVFSSTLLSSAMIVTAMSLERFLAVVVPFFYMSRDRGRQAVVILISIWLTSGIVCSLNLLGFGSVRLFYPGTWCFLNFYGTTRNDKIHSLIYCAIGIVMLTATFVLNIGVICCLMRRNISARGGGRTMCSETRRNREDALAYTVVVLLVIVIIFMICWAPLMVRIIISISVGLEHSPGDLLAGRLMVANTLLDPWVYVLARRNVVNMAMKSIRCIYPKNTTETSESQNTRTP